MVGRLGFSFFFFFFLLMIQLEWILVIIRSSQRVGKKFYGRQNLPRKIESVTQLETHIFFCLA